MTQHWVFWLLSGWVIPLLRANFYASEVQPFGQRVFYFQKAAWEGICDAAMEGMADPAASVFEALSEEGAYRLLSSRSLGYGQLRLVPKKGTVRPLANLSKAMQFTPRPTAGAGRALTGELARGRISPGFGSVNGPLGRVGANSAGAKSN